MSFLSSLKAVFTSSVPDTSESGTLNKTDFAKLTRDFTIVSLSAGLVWVSQNLHLIDLGGYTAALTPIIAVGLQALIKLLKSNSPEQV